MPTSRVRSGIAVGDRLPNLRLPRADSGHPRPLRGPHRDAVVVIALHDPGCDECARFLGRLARARPRFRLWDGSVRAVTDSHAAGPLQDELGDAVDVLVDTDRKLLDRLDVSAGPVTLVADRYGQLFDLSYAGAAHTLAAPRELEEWLKYLATQCPE